MLPLSSSTPLERPYRPVGDSWSAPEGFEQRPFTLTDAGRHCPSVFPCRALDAVSKEETSHHFNPMDTHKSCDMNWIHSLMRCENVAIQQALDPKHNQSIDGI
jgi:hypothetical protein